MAQLPSARIVKLLPHTHPMVDVDDDVDEGWSDEGDSVVPFVLPPARDVDVGETGVHEGQSSQVDLVWVQVAPDPHLDDWSLLILLLLLLVYNTIEYK